MSSPRFRLRLATALLLALAGGAVFAPWIANQRPLLLEVVDRAGFDAARRGQLAVARGLAQRAREGAPPAELAGELAAFDARLDLLRRQLDPADASGVDSLAQRAREFVRTASDGTPDADSVDAFEAAALELREGLVDAGPRLRARRSYPALVATSGSEVAFMLLWLTLLAGWLGAPPRRTAAVGVLAAVLLGSLWEARVYDPAAARTTGIKLALTDGGLEPGRVLFPPLAMGQSETNLTEALRPPTWTRAAKITAEGHYATGARAPGVDGALHPARRVEVRAGEPARNAPLRHVLGTDELGRDVFARLLHGGRVSLAVGLLAATLLTLLGVLIGAVAGFFGGRVDALLLRVIEVVDAIPTLFLVLFAAALTPDGGLHPMIVVALLIALAGWTGVARLVRAEFLRLQPLEFVEAARALGFSHLRVAFRHVLPNALGPAWVAAAFAVSSAILLESAVSFLGFGVQLPVPSWGAMLGAADGLEHWWMFLFPGLLILITVLCTNALGEAVRAALDPWGPRGPRGPR